jgi:predicted acyltransferase
MSSIANIKKVNDQPVTLSETGKDGNESRRINSIDIFRGLTIFVMIFVNDVAGVRNIPQWLQHMPADSDGMTFVDVVFPAFLFIVGMSIPFALIKRLNNGESYFKIWKHILIRTSGLLILGVMMVNMGSLSEDLSGMSKSLWMFLVFISAILIWNNYPKSEERKKIVFLSLRITGIILLVYLAAIFRAEQDGSKVWLQTKWWGILGLIGWAYLAASAVYIFFRKSTSAVTGMLVLFILLYIGERSGNLTILNLISERFISLGSIVGSHAAIATAGLLFSILFFQTENLRAKTVATLVTTGMFFIAGYFLRPLYGISKIYATPAWILYCSAICSFLFLILYWIVDVKNIKKWSGLFKPAGTNPLLAYILPSIVFALFTLFEINFLSEYFGDGLVGIIRSFIFALIIIGITALLTKYHVKLHL